MGGEDSLEPANGLLRLLKLEGKPGGDSCKGLIQCGKVSVHRRESGFQVGDFAIGGHGVDGGLPGQFMQGPFRLMNALLGIFEFCFSLLRPLNVERGLSCGGLKS